MAYRCFKLAVTTNNDHAEAYNNIGVLEWRRGRGEQVRGWDRVLLIYYWVETAGWRGK